MALVPPSLWLAALLAAGAPPEAPCDAAPHAEAPLTPLPGPAPEGERPDWCPPDFTPPARPAVAVPPPRADDTWVDRTHAFIESRLFAPVLRLDRFFSDEKDLEDERARSFVRWRTELRFDAEARPALVSSVRASLRLPGLNLVLRRLRIVIEGQTREAIYALLPEDPQDGRTPGAGAAEFRLDLWRVTGARADLGAGLLFSWPPGAFTRARLRWRWALLDRVVARSALSGFWRTDTRLGTLLEAHLERPFDAAQPRLIRLGSDLLLTQRSRGLEWTPDLTFVAGLGARTALAVGAAAYWTSARLGPGRPRLDRYKVGVRLRRDFFRRWLFFEVEPELYWPWSPEEGRHRAWATTLRVEVQFHGIERRGAAPAEAAPGEDEVDEGARDVAPPVPQG